MNTTTNSDLTTMEVIEETQQQQTTTELTEITETTEPTTPTSTLAETTSETATTTARSTGTSISSGSSSGGRTKSTSTETTDLESVVISSEIGLVSAAGRRKSVKLAVGAYKIEKDEVDEETQTGSCFSCCSGLNASQLASLKAVDRARATEASTSSGGGGGSVNGSRWLGLCKRSFKKSKYCRISYYRNNLSFFLTFLAYLLIQLTLGLLQAYFYSEMNWAVRIARVGGILIDFNSGLVILLVLRRLTTWIRNSVIGRNYLPIDDSIRFHKFVGLFIFVLSIVHTVAHCINLCK
jgi:hypothetical protein